MGRLTVYKSSAGSGKTYTLARTWLELALMDDFRHILAVTFTNKATAEIKTRVLDFLDDLRNGRRPQLARELADTTGLSEAEIQAKAARLLREILHRYDAFRVSTIDSFFQHVLRAFARDLQLDGGYEVELDEKMVLEQAVHAMFQRLQPGTPLFEGLKAFALQKIEQGHSWAIRGDLARFGAELFSETFQTLDAAPDAEALDKLYGKLRALEVEFVRQMREYGKAFMNILDQYELRIEDFFQKKNSIASFFQKLAADAEFVTNLPIPNSYVLNIYQGPEPKWYKEEKKSAVRNELVNIARSNGLQGLVMEALDYYHQHYPAAVTCHAAAAQLYLAGVMGDLRGRVDALMDEQGSLLLADSNRLLHGVLNEGDAPFVYEKIAVRLRHFLIDEFQDTSALQWRNFLPLVEEALSYDEDRRVLLVGDAKQAIYRWRGGRAQILLDVPKVFPFAEARVLNTNYRSARAVVAFNNTFFSHVAEACRHYEFPEAADLVAHAYADAAQECLPDAPEGYVELRILPKDNEDPDAMLRFILEAVQAAQRDGFALRDIAILVRGRKDANRTADYLLAGGVTRVLSESALQLGHAPSALWLICLLRYLERPDDPANLLALARLARVLSGDPAPPEPSSFTRENLAASAPEAVRAARQYLRTLPLSERMLELLRLTSQLAGDGYVLRLLDLARKFEARHGAVVHAFLREWDERYHEKAVVVPEAEDAVRVLTIHKAKGLEFPVVIVPFIDWSFMPNAKNTIWATTAHLPEPFNVAPVLPVKATLDLKDSLFAAQYRQECCETLLDGVNILYVAFTRAKLRLYAAAELKMDKKTGNFELKETKSAAELLYAVGQNASLGWDDEHKYTSGTPVPHVTPSAKAPVALPLLGDMRIEDWRRRPIFRPLHELLTDNKPANWKLLAAEALVALPNRFAAEEWLIKRFDRWVSAGYLAEEDREALLHRITALTQEPALRAWYAGSWTRRMAVLSPEGAMLKPDLILLGKDEAVVACVRPGAPDEAAVELVRATLRALETLGPLRGWAAEGYVVGIDEPLHILSVDK